MCFSFFTIGLYNESSDIFYRSKSYPIYFFKMFVWYIFEISIFSHSSEKILKF